MTSIGDIPVPKLYVSHNRGTPVLVSDQPRHVRKKMCATWRRATASDLLYMRLHQKQSELPEAAKAYLATLKLLDLIR